MGLEPIPPRLKSHVLRGVLPTTRGDTDTYQASRRLVRGLVSEFTSWPVPTLPRAHGFYSLCDCYQNLSSDTHPVTPRPFPWGYPCVYLSRF